MKQILVFTLTLLTSFQIAQAQEAVPQDCMTSKANSIITRKCNEFDTAYKKNFASVCVFKEGAWQWGNLNYDKKVAAHTFLSKAVCDKGIHITPPQTTLAVKPPSVGDYFSGRTTLVNFIRPKYVSLVKVSPLTSNETPIACYSKEISGVPTNPLTCNSDPNSAGYCDFRDVGQRPYFSGSWWVRYSTANQRSYVICEGGVKASDVATALAEYGEQQSFVQVKTMDRNTFMANLPLGNLDEGVNLPYAISACSIASTGNKIVRKPCLNTAATGFEPWSNNESLYRSQVRKEKEKPYIKQINTLKAQISRLAGTSPERAAKQQALDNLNDKIEQLVDAAVADLSVFPVDLTVASENTCYVAWQPLNSMKATDVYVWSRKNATAVLSKFSCLSVETATPVTMAAPTK